MPHILTQSDLVKFPVNIGAYNQVLQILIISSHFPLFHFITTTLVQDYIISYVKYSNLPSPTGDTFHAPSGCLKLWIVPNPIYTVFFPIHTYL